MAKAKEVESVVDVQEIAKALFLSSYRPRSGIDAWMISVECFRAAAEFSGVAGKIAAGNTPDDVIAERQLQDEQHEQAESQNTGGKE